MTQIDLQPAPTFVDGNIVRFPLLNRMSYNLDQVTQATLGRPAAAAPAGKPRCKVALSANASVPSAPAGTTSIATWSVEVYDNDSMFSLSSPQQLVVNTPGWYRITASAAWSSGAAGERVVQVLVNGRADPQNVMASSNGCIASSSVYRHQCMAYEHLDVGAVILCGIWQDSGSSLNLTRNGSWGTWMTAVWDSPY